jgi:exodeoxyribonuclease VII small subunit
MMAKKKSNRSSAEQTDESEDINFEDSLSDVERIVGQLEKGDAGLGESLKLYAAGIKRLKECHDLLSAAERQISLLSGFDADGNAVTEPFGDSVGETLEEKQKARVRRRRSPSPQKKGNGDDSRTMSFEEEVGDDESSTVDGSPGLF